MRILLGKQHTQNDLLAAVKRKMWGGSKAWKRLRSTLKDTSTMPSSSGLGGTAHDHSIVLPHASSETAAAVSSASTIRAPSPKRQNAWLQSSFIVPEMVVPLAKLPVSGAPSSRVNTSGLWPVRVMVEAMPEQTALYTTRPCTLSTWMVEVPATERVATRAAAPMSRGASCTLSSSTISGMGSTMPAECVELPVALATSTFLVAPTCHNSTNSGCRVVSCSTC